MEFKDKKSELIYKCLKNPELLKEFKKDPKKVIEKELNVKFPDNYRLEVLEETPEMGYFVLPSISNVQKCSDEELNKIVAGSGTSMTWCGSCGCADNDVC